MPRLSARRDNDEALLSDSESVASSHVITEEPPKPIRRSSSLFSLSSLEELPQPDESEYTAFRTDDRHFSLIRNLHMADFITLLNGFSGFYSIISCLRFVSTNKTAYIQRAQFFVVLGLFFDFFDGRVARLRNKSSLIGQELDSLADLISFGVAPSCIAFCIGLQTTVDVLVLTFMVLCTLTRLARFNVTVATLPKDEKGKSKFFEGLPAPTTLGLLLLMYILIQKGRINENMLGGLLLEDSFCQFHPFVIAFFVQGCGMISKSLHIPKP